MDDESTGNSWYRYDGEYDTAWFAKNWLVGVSFQVKPSAPTCVELRKLSNAL